MKKGIPQQPSELYELSIRLFENAKETLKKSGINTKYSIYEDVKYTQEASETAYLAALRAIDGYLVSKGLVSPDKLPTSVQGYFNILSNFAKTGRNRARDILGYFHVVYENLHILGHYRGGRGVKMIKEGFDNAEKIIQIITKYKK